jgi:hypothetical protein
LIKNEVERVLNEADVAYLTVLSWHSGGWTEKTMKIHQMLELLIKNEVERVLNEADVACLTVLSWHSGGWIEKKNTEINQGNLFQACIRTCTSVVQVTTCQFALSLSVDVVITASFRISFFLAMTIRSNFIYVFQNVKLSG